MNVKSNHHVLNQYSKQHIRQILDTFLDCIKQIERTFERILADKHQRLIVSNIGIPQRKKREMSYSLIIDTEQLIYAEKDSSHHDKYRFFLQSFELEINDRVSTPDGIDSLIGKITFVLDQFKKDQAIVYTQRIPSHER